MGYKSIGKQLQLAREEAGFSQEQLAAKIGCSQSTLSNYEKGKRRIYLAQLEKIAEVLNKPIQFFLQAQDYENYGNTLVKEKSISKTAADATAGGEEQNLWAILQSLSPEGQQLVMDFALWLKKREVGNNG